MAKIDPSDFLEIVADVIDGVDTADLSIDQPLKEVPEWDSLARLSVLAELEDRFGVDIGSAELVTCKTFEDLRSMVEGRIS
jgi:acyl carrier protein